MTSMRVASLSLCAALLSAVLASATPTAFAGETVVDEAGVLNP
ncbi:hypothetical protein [Hyphomicrobium denitrificans]|nr:hypothetical protein [Hyphomicrobium denitrificans]